MQIKQTPSFERQLKKLTKKHFPRFGLKGLFKGSTQTRSGYLKRIKDHALKGKWRGYRECHPARHGGSYGQTYDSWIVIYQLNNEELVLLLVATGSHEILDQ